MHCVCVCVCVCVCTLHCSSVPVEGGPFHCTLMPLRSADDAVASCAAQIQRLGYPSMENLHFKADHVLSYNNRMRSANWVFEVCVLCLCVLCLCVYMCVCVWCGVCEIFVSSLQVLTQERCYNKMANRDNSSFRPDEQISELFRADDDDYKKSRFDRGHLAAAANHFHDQSAMDDTFLFTNISPQVLTLYYHMTVT